jgi:hypothetical protein
MSFPRACLRQAGEAPFALRSILRSDEVLCAIKRFVLEESAFLFALFFASPKRLPACHALKAEI